LDQPVFQYYIHIGAPLEKVWEALTNNSVISKYFFGLTVRSDWRVGAFITYVRPDGSIDIHGEITKYEVNKTLGFTFRTHVDIPRNRPTEVTFELLPMMGGVKLMLTHEYLLPADGEKRFDTLRGLNNGWPAILSNMKSVLETGKACLDLSLINNDGTIKK
jgi:uncharacterized protein YndB with AHSA1/START domain